MAGLRLLVWTALAAGLVIRVAILWHTADVGPRIADEQQYLQLATSLAEGRGFAWATGELTSLRPPLYPAFVAGLWQISGVGSLQAVRIAQCVMSLLTAWLIFDLGRRAFTPAVGAVAFAIVWLYPALIFLDVTLLTETLFTLLLVAFVWLAVRLVQRPAGLTAVACGVCLGLGALTRSVLWPVPAVLGPLLLLVLPGRVGRRVLLVGLFFSGFAAVVAPWAVRNTRLQGVTTIVDTMGGMNLRMGNYEHTPEDRMWDAVSMTGDKSWVHALTEELASAPPTGPFTEGMKDKWAQRKAIEYMRAHPVTTLRRSTIKFSDFWGLDRSFTAGVQQGLYDPPAWFFVLGTLASLAACAGVLLAGAAGLWIAPPAWPVHAVLLLPIVIVTGVHSVVFGHPRYHDPLVPLLALYGGAAIVGVWNARRAPRTAWAGACLTMGLLLAIWARQVLIVDGARIWSLLEQWL